MAGRTKETERQLPVISPLTRSGTRHAHAVIYLAERSTFVDLEPGRAVVLGRSDEADVEIDTATVSRRHVELLWDQGQLRVRDLGSTNGTLINGQRLEGASILQGGEEIAIGEALVIVGLSSPPRLERLRLPAVELPALDRGPVAADPVTVRLFSLSTRVAAAEATVLLVGETGVGKDVIARELHRQSPRRSGGPLVHVNCGALPQALFARELFGHEPGAFTGASTTSPGLFEAASGGTLFLDEVSTIPLSEQPRLLRALEHRRVTRLGGTEEIPVDLRIVAATNHDLDDLVAQGLFREDLLYRLNVITIFVPALRDRPADIAALARRFVEEQAAATSQPDLSLSPEAIHVLERHDWPGNIRELRNVIERTLLSATSPRLGSREMIAALYGDALPQVERLDQLVDLKALIEEVERHAIGQALERCKGNQSLAARRLGISRRTLIYKMQRYDLGNRKLEPEG